MDTEKKLYEIEKNLNYKREVITKFKTFLKDRDYDTIIEWIKGLNKQEVLLVMFELSKDPEFNKEFSIIEGYYLYNSKKIKDGANR